MHRLIIHKLGPIEHCELECSQFMTLTGFQASGKSTIAKAIYYFRTIKDDIEKLILQKKFTDNSKPVDLEASLVSYLHKKFLRTFGLSSAIDRFMYTEYYFTKERFIKVTFNGVELSNTLKTHLAMWVNNLSPKELLDSGIFLDKHKVVYIPAGRSMITLLSQQFNYIYATMNDGQKRLLDSCTQDYMERILRLKPEFSDGLEGLLNYYSTDLQPEVLNQALDLIKKVFRGAYRCQNGEEQVILEDGKYIKINFSSSGQQESVWILNLLFYYLLQPTPTLFIIEEPESHLFPESQKYITELIALVNNQKHSIVLTTHSPYVLGALNNLLYAHSMPEKYHKQANDIIPKSLWLDDQNFNAWFVRDGMIEDCMDAEMRLIQNEKIDEISKTINNDFDRLFELWLKNEESTVM